ncbi:hypothetical protein RYX36_037299 [Vicia faba]
MTSLVLNLYFLFFPHYMVVISENLQVSIMSSHHSKTVTLSEICFILQGDSKVYLLAGVLVAFILHVIGIYRWYQNDDILYPLVMLPPNPTPFWHAIFTILVNGMDLFTQC